MASPINPAFTNRINTIAIGESHNATLYTDRKIDGSSLAPSGAPARSKINRTITTPWIDDRGVVYSNPGSGDFNPEVLP